MNSTEALPIEQVCNVSRYVTHLLHEAGLYSTADLVSHHINLDDVESLSHELILKGNDFDSLDHHQRLLLRRLEILSGNQHGREEIEEEEEE